jgi:hypothetical protein
VAASFVWFDAAVSGLPRLGATLTLVVGAWLLVAADYAPQRLYFAAQAMGLLVIAALKWALIDTLASRIEPTWNAREYLPLLNPVMGMGLVLALSLVGVMKLRRAALERTFATGTAPAEALWDFGGIVALLAIVTLGLSFEVDRFIERTAALNYDWVWPLEQVKHFGLTLLWLAALGGMIEAARRQHLGLWWPRVLFLGVVAKFLFIDMIGMRLGNSHPAAVPVLWNLEVGAACIVLAGLFAMRYWISQPAPDEGRAALLRGLTALLALLVVLWAGTLEIDRPLPARSGPVCGIPAWRNKWRCPSSGRSSPWVR